jgi:hypothetical protein
MERASGTPSHPELYLDRVSSSLLAQVILAEKKIFTALTENHLGMLLRRLAFALSSARPKH